MTVYVRHFSAEPGGAAEIGEPPGQPLEENDAQPICRPVRRCSAPRLTRTPFWRIRDCKTPGGAGPGGPVPGRGAAPADARPRTRAGLRTVGAHSSGPRG